MLQEHGHTVVGMDADWFKDCLFTVPQYKLQETKRDIRTVHDENELKGYDAIIYLANLCNDPLGWLNPTLTYKINHAWSMRFAYRAMLAGVERFVFASSCSVYGNADGVVDESSELNPLTPYAGAKFRMEDSLDEFGARAQMLNLPFTPVSLRNATVYGVSPRLRTDIVVNDLVKSAYVTGKVTLLSDGTAMRPLVHVRDVCRVFVLALEAPKDVVHRQKFNIGSENLAVLEIAKIVANITEAEVEIGTSGADTRSYEVDFSKAKRQLNFKPNWEAWDGVEELWDAFEATCVDGVLAGHPIEWYKFNRLKRIQYLQESEQIDYKLFWKE